MTYNIKFNAKKSKAGGVGAVFIINALDMVCCLMWSKRCVEFYEDNKMKKRKPGVAEIKQGFLEVGEAVGRMRID